MSTSRKSASTALDIATMDGLRRPSRGIRSFTRRISTGGIPSSQRLGIIPWLTLGLATVLLLLGAFLAFPLALLCAIWGFSTLRLVAPAARWTVVVYVVLSAVLMVLMLIGLLAFTPTGELVHTPMGSTEWTPVESPPGEVWPE